MRATTIWIFAPAILLGAGLQAFAGGEQERERPNVLFIAVDDMRAELGCYGSGLVKSPNIDELARTGVLFKRAYCAQAVCNASRASLLTGLRPDSTRVWDLATPMRETIQGVVTLPQHFKRQGYYTLAVGKIYHNTFPDRQSWSIAQPRIPATKGYSEASLERLAAYREQMRRGGEAEARVERMRGPATDDEDVPDEARFDGAMTERAMGLLRELKDREEPWFLGVGYIRPHLPFSPPKKYWDLYDPEEIPLAENPWLPEGGAPMSMFGQYELRGYMDMVDVGDPPALIDEARQRRLKHGYYASVSYTDAMIGKLLGELERLGLAEETIVVLWSDHGWKLGEHASWGKQTNYELDTNSPLIVRAPGAKGNGRASEALVEFVDIYPTLCDLAGLPVPEGLEGKSFKAVLEDPTAAHKQAAISQYLRRYQGGEYMGYALRTDRYRFIEWIDRKTGEVVARELYDHEVDPQENRSVAGEPGRGETVEELSRQLWETIPRPGPIEGKKEARSDR